MFRYSSLLSFLNLTSLDTKNKKIYIYGLLFLFNYILIITFTFLITRLFGLGFELILFTFFIMLLRSYTGGFHFKKYYKCMLVSVLELFLIGYIFKNIDPNGFFCFLLSIIISGLLFLLSPVDTENRRLTNIEKERISKKILLLLIIGIFVLVPAFVFKFNNFVYSYFLALLHCLILVIFGIIDNRTRK